MQRMRPRHVDTCIQVVAWIDTWGWNVSGCKWIFARNNWRGWHASSASPTFRSFINSNSHVRPNVTVVGWIAFWKVADENYWPFLSASLLLPASKLTSTYKEDHTNHRPPLRSWLLRDIVGKETRPRERQTRGIKKREEKYEEERMMLHFNDEWGNGNKCITVCIWCLMRSKFGN